MPLGDQSGNYGTAVLLLRVH